MVDDGVTNFKMVVADWGSSHVRGGGPTGGQFLGGTPVYGGPQTFHGAVIEVYKDLFSFGRLAMELFMDKPGTELKSMIDSYFLIF